MGAFFSSLSLVLDPLIPLLWLGALITFLLLLMILGLWLRLRGSWLRTLTFIALIGVLLNPIIQREQQDPLSDFVLVIVDQSPSQQIAPRSTQAQAAETALLTALAALENTEVKRTVFGGLDDLETDQGTHLQTALVEAMLDIPANRLAAVFIISDGQIHDLKQADLNQGLNLPKGIPINLLLTGRENEPDQRLTVLSAPRYGITNAEVTVEVQIDQEPLNQNTDVARLVVRQNGVAIDDLFAPVGSPFELTLPIDEAGRRLFELILDPDQAFNPQELTTANNRAVIEVNGVRERLRVLLISGQPHQAERAWRNLLKSDPSVDLVHFNILRPLEKADTTPSDELSLIEFPVRQLFGEQISDFDLIIFDQYPYRRILSALYLDNIARFVRNGGTLLMATGPAFADSRYSLYNTPLSTVIPATPTGKIIEEPFQPTLTETGKQHPITNSLPIGFQEPNSNVPSDAATAAPTWGPWFQQIEAEVKRGHVLMTGAQGKPLLIVDRLEEGRVGQLMSGHFWLWARGYQGGGPHHEMLRRLSHWLMREPQLEEEALEAFASGQELRIVRRSLDNQARHVKVIDPLGQEQILTLTPNNQSQYEAILPTDIQGVYQIEDHQPLEGEPLQILVGVGALNAVELHDPRSSDIVLKPFIEASNGLSQRLPNTGLESLALSLQQQSLGTVPSPGQGFPIVPRSAYRLLGVQRLPLLPVWLALLLVSGLLVGAWVRESR